MNNILLLNLGTDKDILLSSHLISSFREEYPNSNISLLIYKDQEHLAKLLNGVYKIFTIDADFIQKVMENPLYSDAFALNQFANDIEEVSKTHWHKIINYSNDNASAYLMNTFTTDQVIGTYINERGTAQTTDTWSTYQNYVMTRMNRRTLSLASVRNHMAMTPNYSDVEKVKIDQEYLFIANQNFNRIRQMNGGNARYVIGINLEVGYDGNAIDEGCIREILEAIEESEDYKAVLLTSGKSYQKEIVNRLNAHFNNSLVSINVDSAAISSVISNIDALVSTANNQMMVADALEVRLIEIKDLSQGQFITPTTENEGNYVIYKSQQGAIASDILLALNEIFETELPVTVMNSEHPTYVSIQDDYGVYFTQIRGELNISSEIDYHLSRSIHFEILGYPKNEELIKHIRENTDRAEITKYTNNVKTELTEAVKILLSTLRSLKGANSSKTNLNNFITYLDQLMNMGANDTIVGSVIRLFEGNIENITSTSADDNMKDIETNLFALKSNLQVVTNVISDLMEEKSTTQKTEHGVKPATNA